MDANDGVAIDLTDWLTPAQALERLPPGWDMETRKRWIYRRLASGEIAAVAMKFNHNRQQSNGKPTVVRAEFWDEPWQKSDTDFWVTGDISITDAEPFAGIIILDGRPTAPVNRISLYDVKLNPSAFPSAVSPDQSSPVIIPEQSQRRRQDSLCFQSRSRTHGWIGTRDNPTPQSKVQNGQPFTCFLITIFHVIVSATYMGTQA